MLESLLTVSHLFADVAASQKAVRDHIKTLNNNKACYEQVAQKYCKYIVWFSLYLSIINEHLH